MPDCEYCGATFDDEGALLDHLGAEHYDDLGRIDRRRVDEHRGGGGFDAGTYLALGGGLALFVGIVYFLFFAGGSGPATTNGVPATPYGTLHEHGTIEMTVAGQQVDFSQPRYQYSQTRVRAFHFEGGNGRVWHTHARGVTLQYAMDTLGIHVTENSVTVGGTTYNDSDPDTTVIVEVNGQPVDPATYVLSGAADPTRAGQDGDNVRIVVRVEG